jgi:2-keto-4-pentenoate hydratase/2-oxohepta-3-ene-1,7-dioic acid hydratase in catechol pathway
VVGEYEGRAVRHDGEDHPVGEDADLLAPCEPSALYCVGRNYVATIDQQGYDRPEEPDFFVKPPVSVLDPGETLPCPSFTGELVGAGELAAVVGRDCSDLVPGDIPDAIEGYTIMNDLDAYDQPGRTARKAFDGSAPLGPCLATDVDPTDLAMETRVNGTLDHEANTGDMLFDPFEVV